METGNKKEVLLKRLFLIIFCIFLVSLVPVSVGAQGAGFTAKPLLQASLSNDCAQDAVMRIVEFAPGGYLNPHTHPGDEVAYVLQGTLEIIVDGRETRKVSAGDSFHNPRGLIHQVRNAGDTPVRVLVIYIVDKGKPASQPAAK